MTVILEKILDEALVNTSFRSQSTFPEQQMPSLSRSPLIFSLVFLCACDLVGVEKHYNSKFLLHRR